MRQEIVVWFGSVDGAYFHEAVRLTAIVNVEWFIVSTDSKNEFELFKTTYDIKFACCARGYKQDQI